MARFVVGGINNHNLWNDGHTVNTGDFIMFYTVWVGGVESADYYLTKTMAEHIANNWRKMGYTDVVVEKVVL